jgi:hypothetical protein
LSYLIIVGLYARFQAIINGVYHLSQTFDAKP